MTNERLRRTNRIRSAKEYQEHFRKARRLETPSLIFYFRPSAAEQSRLGMTVSRKVGKAVQRNRLKRRLREIFRKHLNAWSRLGIENRKGFDLVVRPKPAATECEYGDLERQMHSAIKQLLAGSRRHQKRARSPRAKGVEPTESAR